MADPVSIVSPHPLKHVAIIMDGNNRWAKQAYAFVHMCLYGLNGKYQKPFATFLQRLAREPASEEMFRQVFNRTYKQMLLELRGYIDFTVYQHREYRSKEDVIVPPAPVEGRDAGAQREPEGSRCSQSERGDRPHELIDCWFSSGRYVLIMMSSE